MRVLEQIEEISLCEECQNTELFLVRIFLYSDWTQRDTSISPYLIRIKENTAKNNSVFGHFSRSDVNSNKWKTEVLRQATFSGKGISVTWCLARFSIICTIQKTWKTWRRVNFSATLLKVALLHGYFSHF